MSRRTERINALLREQLSELVQRGVKDPRVTGLVSITAVEVTKDLSQAKVHVSVYGTPEERASVLVGLTSAASFFRRELRQRLDLRWIPDLVFVADTSIERGARVLELMRQLDEGERVPEPEP
ncbi:MAG TPA: 30S ribosome-binding factor RbfA [Dehalococcoidia bacterium]|jgi:ribosome-binding factor A|nr:30S ribosome-binding factor RbfA [Dehalococcoidia bacterium]